MSSKSCRDQSASRLTSVNAVYSASFVDRATRVCFLDDHDITAFPSMKTYPPIDFFRSFVFLRFLSTLFTAVRCLVRGLALKLLSIADIGSCSKGVGCKERVDLFVPKARR